jgi:hypothetical protein
MALPAPVFYQDAAPEGRYDAAPLRGSMRLS